MPTLPPGPRRNRPVPAAKTPSNNQGPALKNVVHRGTPAVGPAPTPRISPFVTVTWAWADITTGLITWTFTNTDQSNSHAVVLYRGGAETPTYIFGGAYWPIYLSAGYGINMLDGTQPLPTLSSGSTQPMGILDFGTSASPRYLVAFIFNLAPGQTFSTNEGFTPNAGPTTYQCYALDSSVTGNYCVGYDPGRVANFNSNPLVPPGSTQPGYSPNPKVFYTYAFTPESATPDNELGYNDSIAAGTCTTPNFYFVTNQNTFGRDEVADNPSYPLSFYLFLEGYTPSAVGTSIPTFSSSSSFNSTNIPGLTYPPDVVPVTYDLGGIGTAYADVPQRIRFGYDINFTAASLASASAFPAAGSATPNPYTLQAAISILGVADALTPDAEFYLLGGDDPYFTNINTGPNAGITQPYLSQDLRVFTGTPAINSTPVAGPGPVPSIAPPTLADSVTGAYNYIEQLITWLNQQYGYLNPMYTPPDTNVSDPLDSLLPDQGGALNGDSSATPFTGTDRNYNFAIARVRLKGSSGMAAQASGVKVFFRLMTTQTFDTDFINSTTVTTTADPQVTYPSAGALNDPQSPQPGTDHTGVVNGCSLPFFATENFNSSPTDYLPAGINNQDIEIPTGQDYTWAFFGCFLNVNDATNTFGTLPLPPFGPAPVQFWLAPSAHNCLVAQIAYTQAPIINENGVIESPENSNKLAQRNLQVTTSGNPGFPATHLVPQTIDVRPSPPPQSTDPTSILSYPDEMMIDWGNKLPLGSVATLYWPGVSASAVLQLASELYPAQTLTAADAHTIQFTVSSPVTYIPIPTGSGASFAGLITVQLPSTVRYGNEFDVVVRRITTKQVTVPNQPPQPPQPIPQAATRADQPKQLLWRYITGSFLAKVQVEEAKKTLPIDENLLAILKWRLGLIGKSNRWYPVLLRYIHCLTGRINHGGGDASNIPGSPNGYPQPTTGHGQGHGHGGHGEHCCTGKVIAIRYDRFGDFEGFTLLSEEGHEHWFRGREKEVEELVKDAWIDRTLIGVKVEAHDPEWPASIILLRQK